MCACLLGREGIGFVREKVKMVANGLIESTRPNERARASEGLVLSINPFATIFSRHTKPGNRRCDEVSWCLCVYRGGKGFVWNNIKMVVNGLNESTRPNERARVKVLCFHSIYLLPFFFPIYKTW